MKGKTIQISLMTFMTWNLHLMSQSNKMSQIKRMRNLMRMQNLMSMQIKRIQHLRSFIQQMMNLMSMPASGHSVHGKGKMMHSVTNPCKRKMMQ